jgi:hypothetical protein
MMCAKRWDKCLGLRQNYTRSGAIHQLPLQLENQGFAYFLHKS